MATDNSSFDDALQKFGLRSFRPGQREVIESIVSGDDCICIMPTGGGKSLCYQLPSIIRPGLTIVVSPLIALMKDQVDSLSRRGIPSALINSTLSQSEQTERLQDVAAGKFQLVYVAPERLRNNKFMEAIRATPIQLLAIDEAHCISQWGHDFRPDYARIGRFREWLGGVQTVALTATATPRVRDDIVQVLGLKRPKQFMSGFARPNLHFGVVQRQTDREKDEELESFLKRTEGSGIIYSATRKRCDALVEMIADKLKISVGAYHAGLMPDQRRAIQERFMKNQLRIIVATNAFGMGIDKPDLRFVVHYNMPGSLEAYYQEAGRAGRDGHQSVCVMLYSFQDRYIQEFFIDNNYPARDVVAKVYEFLQKRDEDPIELTLEEIRDALGLNISPESVGSAMQILARTSVLERLERGGGLAMVRIDSQLPSLVDMLPREANVRRKVLRVVERIIGDRRGEQVFVHPRWLLQETGLERDALSRVMRELCRLDGFDYVPPFRGRAVHFVKRGITFSDLGIDFAALDKLKQSEYDRLNQVVSFAQSPLCRQATILNYFGDLNAENCGQCDRCSRSPGWPPVKLVAPPAVEMNDEPLSVRATDRQGQGSLFAADDSPTGGDSGPGSSRAAAAIGKSNEPAAAQSTRDQPELKRPATTDSKISQADQVAFLERVIGAIERIHGRIGKILLAQYLCGSQNSKLQKLNLHRLAGFGMLTAFRQSDAVAFLDCLLANGLLRQQEVNRNRPTVSVSPELLNVDQRRQLLSSVRFEGALERKIAGLVRQSSQTIPAIKADDTDQSSENATERSGSIGLDTIDQYESSRATLPAASQPPEIKIDHSGAVTALPPKTSPTSLAQKDWEWTLGLFVAGHNWEEVLLIRRMTDEQLAASLCLAIRGGARVERQWLALSPDGSRSAGQSSVIRELRRQSTAWVN